MKPLTDNMKQMLAVLAGRDARYSDNLNTLNALQSRSLCVVWVGSHWSGLHGAKITDAGRELADELTHKGVT